MRKTPRYEHVTIPLWMPFLGIAITTALIRRTHLWRADRRGICRDCGYNLTGNVSGVCPECGTQLKDQS